MHRDGTCVHDCVCVRVCMRAVWACMYVRVGFGERLRGSFHGRPVQSLRIRTPTLSLRMEFKRVGAV
jgi:hypothetical protein